MPTGYQNKYYLAHRATDGRFLFRGRSRISSLADLDFPGEIRLKFGKLSIYGLLGAIQLISIPFSATYPNPDKPEPNRNY